jgi:hypothetical protein
MAGGVYSFENSERLKQPKAGMCADSARPRFTYQHHFKSKQLLVPILLR